MGTLAQRTSGTKPISVAAKAKGAFHPVTVPSGLHEIARRRRTHPTAIREKSRKSRFNLN